MGFDENPQNYIVSVTKYAQEEIWQYPTYIPASQNTKEVDFNHFVTVQYVNIEKSNSDERGLIRALSWFDFNKEMFYPAFIRSNGA